MAVVGHTVQTCQTAGSVPIQSGTNVEKTGSEEGDSNAGGGGE